MEKVWRRCGDGKEIDGGEMNAVFIVSEGVCGDGRR